MSISVQYSYGLVLLQDFGLRLGGDVASDVASNGKGKSLNMPITTAKPTTTTDRLPINPDGLLSHVAHEVSQSFGQSGESINSSVDELISKEP